jgi:hypothetical protein
MSSKSALHVLSQIVRLGNTKLTVLQVEADFVLVHEVLAQNPCVILVLFNVNIAHSAVEDRH